jgi:vancomycin resistance protein VanJ
MSSQVSTPAAQPIDQPVDLPTESAARGRNRWLGAFTAVNALMLALLWGLENAVGEHTNPTTLLLYMPQHPLVLPTLCLVGASLWKLNYRFFACNLWILCAWAFSFAGFQVPFQAPRPFWQPAQPTVRIMMWNVRGWSLGPQTAPSQIRSLAPDILCLAEAYPPAPRPGFPRSKVVLGNDGNWESQFPGYQVLRAGDVSILSRFPLLSSSVRTLKGSYGRQLLIARWQTPRGPLTTVAVHVSTALSPEYKAENEYNKPSRWKQIIRHAQATAQTRAAQWPAIQSSVAGVSGPYIVAGDFNNPPRGLLYHRLARNWQDGFGQAGWGCGYTFPAKHPLMRIDYIWASPSLRVNQCFSPETRASDHRPVVADVSF